MEKQIQQKIILLRCIIYRHRITIARGATRKIKKIQSLGALVYCAAPLRPQIATLLVRAPRFSSERRAFSQSAALLARAPRCSSERRTSFRKAQFWRATFHFGALWPYGHAVLGNDVSKFTVWRTTFHFGALWPNGQPQPCVVLICHSKNNT